MSRAARLVVLASGSGTTLQALLDASAAPSFGADVVAVGTDRPGIEALARAERAGAATFIVRTSQYGERDEWDAALADAVAAYEPQLVISAGFMKLVGPHFLKTFGGRFVNSHPALLEHGVKITGCTLFVVDDGVDTGPIVAQAAVPVLDTDDEASLHERIKIAEREMLVEHIGRMAREGWTITGRKVTIP
jgi:phosphoribosylglycinamide formyltransferase-1